MKQLYSTILVIIAPSPLGRGFALQSCATEGPLQLFAATIPHNPLGQPVYVTRNEKSTRLLLFYLASFTSCQGHFGCGVCTRYYPDYHRLVRTEKSGGFGIVTHFKFLPSCITEKWGLSNLFPRLLVRRIPLTPHPFFPDASRTGDCFPLWAGFIMLMELISSLTSKNNHCGGGGGGGCSSPALLWGWSIISASTLPSPLRYCDRGAVASENCVILNPQLDSVLCSCVRKRAEKKNLLRTSLFAFSCIKTSGQTFLSLIYLSICATRHLWTWIHACGWRTWSTCRTRQEPLRLRIRPDDGSARRRYLHAAESWSRELKVSPV